MKRFLPPLLLPFLLFSFSTTGHLSNFHHFKIATLLNFAFLWLLVPWMIVPLLILCVRFKEKNKSDPTLRGNTSRTPTTNNAETIDTAPSQKQQIGVGSTVVSPPQPALPFQNGSTMKTSDEQIDDKPSGKEERKGDDKNWIPRGANQEKDSASKKTGIPYSSNKYERNSPKPKLNKSRKSDKQNTPLDSTKLLVSQSGKEKKEKATAWPVRPKWSESVPESQVADDLSDFGLTKRTDPTMNVSGFVDDKKKEDKKEEMKEDPTKSSVFLDDVKKEKEEKKEEGKDEKKEEKREEKKEEEREVKKDEKEEKKEEKKE